MVITGVLVGSALAADESSPLLIVMTGVFVGGTLGADESPPLLMVISVAAAETWRLPRNPKSHPSLGADTYHAPFYR